MLGIFCILNKSKIKLGIKVVNFLNFNLMAFRGSLKINKNKKKYYKSCLLLFVVFFFASKAFYCYYYLIMCFYLD